MTAVASTPDEPISASSALSPGNSAVDEALDGLVRAALSGGRDLKLVSAMLRTVSNFLLEHGADAAVGGSSERNGGEPDHHDEMAASPALRSRLRAVIRSLSDDETGRLLAVGARQVQRRARSGSLYFFQVSQKRRFPCWQFLSTFAVPPGLRLVAQVLPRDWPPEAVDAFMTTKHPQLLIGGVPHSPVQWLVNGGGATTVRLLLDPRSRI